MCHSLFDGLRKLRLRDITVLTCDHRANQEAFLKPGHLTTTEEMPGRGTHTFISIALFMAGITNQSALFSFLLFSPSPLPAFLNPPLLSHQSKMVRGRNLQPPLAMAKNNLSGVSFAFDCSKTFFIYSHFILHTKPGNQQKALELKSCPPDPNLSQPTKPTHPVPQPPKAASGAPGGLRPRQMWPPSWTWIKMESKRGVSTTVQHSWHGKTKSPFYKSGNRAQRGQHVTQGYTGNKQGWSQDLNSE